jgi:hypothetical protein
MQYKGAKLGQGCYKVLRPIIPKLFVRLKVPGREYVLLLLEGGEVVNRGRASSDLQLRR